ncbi:MAG: T9SS type A sorting domain-containing protein, partial [Bacteroidetes bacterium]|nr:T9SS type A sorting domain-containing protein [Bacteroidota bacterium]
KNKTFTLVGKPTGGVWSSGGVLSITNLGVVTTGPTLGAGSITYVITAGGCNSSRTISANVVTCSSKGVNNQQAISNEQLVIYPNPAHSLVNLQIDKLVGRGSIVVTDLYGKTVKQQSLSMGTNTIDVSTFAKGMYLVSVITDQGKQTQKVVVE